MTITPDDLQQFTCTENYYKTLSRNVWYSDGAQFLFEHGRCYWLLDLILFEAMAQPTVADEPFNTVDINVASKQATLIVTDGNDKILFEKHIPYTDMPEGKWRLFINETYCGDIEGKLIYLPSEH